MMRRRWAAGIAGAMVVAGSTTLLPTTPTTAAAPPQAKVDSALGNGLGRLLAQSERPSLKAAGGFRLNPNALTIRDDQGRVLLQLTPQAGVDRAAFRRQAESRGFDVQNVDSASGTLEGFAPLSAVRDLSAMKDTGTLAQALKPKTNVGKATSQGVALERIDKVQAKGVDGKGITIGALSDSYDAALSTIPGDPLTIHASDDVKSGDLPGKGNAKYPKPVVVIEDSEPNTSDFDEGRAMLQIAHDIAPASKLCFATANGGLLNFANNVRKLADKSGPCGANVIVDDVIYFDEPMFSESVLTDAIDDVAAKGVHYFTSAGNEGEQQSWNSKVHLIPAKQAVKGSNINLDGVDPALYDGGFQDMNPGSGTDIAQDVALGETGGVLDFQWNDPYDLDGATYGPSIFDAKGEVTATNPEPSFTFTPTASQLGQTVEFRTDAIPSGETDLILSVDAPDGTNLGTIDTGSSPEVLVATLDQAGPYKITVSGFDGDTGDFTVGVRPVTAPSKVSTDFNVLLFDEDGNFLTALSDQNTLSGRPSEVAGLPGSADIGIPGVQIAISRHGTGKVGATEMRNVFSGDLAMTEYADPLSPAIFGHALGKQATGVAAYDPFKSYLPEPYTAPGGDLPVYFNSQGKRYSKPQIRRTPKVAGADRGNTTFFVADDARDPDTQPNFGGTSASAPHVASIAALALQKAGGPKSLSPDKLRQKLTRSTFAHDLDPMFAGGYASGLKVTATGNQGREVDTVPGSMNDPRFFSVSYSGKSSLKSLTFLGETASPTALGKNSSKSDGIVFDTRPFLGTSPFRDQGFPFTIGGTWGGLGKGQVKPTFSGVGKGESVAGQFSRLKLSFNGGLKSGQGLRFGIDRDLAVSGFGGANEGNGADELGGSIFLPQGTGDERGLVFVGELANGKKITGVMRNDLGYGFTPVDGYGLVDAQKAVLGR